MCSSDLSPRLLARDVAEIKEKRPEIHLQIQEGTQEMLLSALRRGEIDVMIGRFATGRQVSDLVQEKLYVEEFRIVAGAGERQRRLRNASLAELVDEPWIMYPAWVPLRQHLDRLFMAECGHVPGNVVECTHPSVILPLIQRGPFLALLPSHVSAVYAESRMITEIPLRLPALNAPVALIQRAGAGEHDALAYFVQVLKSRSLLLDRN